MTPPVSPTKMPTPGFKTAPTLQEALRTKAHALGFDLCRVAPVRLSPEIGERLRAWVHSGAHGGMDWMADTLDRRADPQALWSEARSIIMLGVNYGPGSDPLEVLAHPKSGSISVYARHRDYHDLLKGRLKELAAFLLKQAGQGEAKVFVDTAPVMEKPLAQLAGLGWQGKHTNLVSRDFGSWLFLGAIFTTLDLTPDAPEKDHCGICRACLDICPTQAFPEPNRLDARRCISYLTIEHKGPIPHEFRSAIGNRIYGCDDCLAVCPWNKFAQITHEMKLAARADLNSPLLAVLSRLDDAAFRAFFAGSPVKRIGRTRFLRNVLIAMGNSGAPSLALEVLPHLDDPSPLIRGAAVWALARLFPERAQAQARLALTQETDPDVLGEWARVMDGRQAPPTAL